MTNSLLILFVSVVILVLINEQGSSNGDLRYGGILRFMRNISWCIFNSLAKSNYNGFFLDLSFMDQWFETSFFVVLLLVGYCGFVLDTLHLPNR